MPRTTDGSTWSDGYINGVRSFLRIRFCCDFGCVGCVKWVSGVTESNDRRLLESITITETKYSRPKCWYYYFMALVLCLQAAHNSHVFLLFIYLFLSVVRITPTLPNSSAQFHKHNIWLRKDGQRFTFILFGINSFRLLISEFISLTVILTLRTSVQHKHLAYLNFQCIALLYSPIYLYTTLCVQS